MRRHAGLWLAAAVLLASPAAAEKIGGAERFRLWSACLPMSLIVESFSDRAAFGLTEQAVLTTARSRLRAARIYDDGDASRILALTINILNDEPGRQTYGLGFQYLKLMTDAASGEINLAISWDSGSVGYGDHVFVLAKVSERIDEFIDEYLRVNADACE